MKSQNDYQSLDELINEVFANETNEVIRVLETYDLKDELVNAIGQIESINRIDELEHSAYVSYISSNLLTRINSTLQSITDRKLKAEVEYILGELSKQILARFIERTNRKPIEILGAISKSLEVTCNLNSWDFSGLKRVLNWDLLYTISVKSSSPEIEIKAPPTIQYYQWNGSSEDLKNLSYNLKDHKLIKSAHEFQSLFETNTKTRFRIDREKRDFIVLLFGYLYERRIITPKGKNSKLFTPLKDRLCDFENNLLDTGALRQLKYKVKKNPVREGQIVEMIKKWLGE